MTTPTTDADRVACTMQVLHDIVSGWRCDTLDGFEALAKVRALLSEGSEPEPGSFDDFCRDFGLTRSREAVLREMEECVRTRLTVDTACVHNWAAALRATVSRGEPAKVRDESQPPPLPADMRVTPYDDGYDTYVTYENKRTTVRIWSHPRVSMTCSGDYTEAMAAIDHHRGYAPQGAPPLPDGWTVDRHDGEDASWWEAYRESDAASIQWWDDNDLVIDVNVGECSRGDEVLAVMQHLAARRKT